jgi:hypothetical protein
MRSQKMKPALGCAVVLLAAALIAAPPGCRAADSRGAVVAPQTPQPTAEKPRGHALIIGNSRYRYTAPLANPANDATDIAAALEKLGFAVALKVDASLRAMENEIKVFGRRLRDGGVGLFYYAGHGVQVAGRNYLIPIDADVDSESDIRYEAVDAGRLLGKMEDAGNGTNIIILDACRNNPFSSKFRSVARGLAKMDAPAGSLIAYSTAPGSVASDGEGRNGLYTAKLLELIDTEGLTIEDCLKKVRIAVMDATGNKQVPWESSSLTVNFYFIEPGRTAAVAPEPDRDASVEILFWESVKDSRNVKLYQSYLDQFPNGSFAPLARIYIQEYGKEAAVAAHRTPAAEGDRPLETGGSPTASPRPEPTGGGADPTASGRPTEAAALAPQPVKPAAGRPEPSAAVQSPAGPEDAGPGADDLAPPPRRQLSVALLPCRFGGIKKTKADAGFDGYRSVARAIAGVDGIDLRFDHRQFDNSGAGAIWKRKSLFSAPKFSFSKALEFSRTLNVDIAVVVRTKPLSNKSWNTIGVMIIDAADGVLYVHEVDSVYFAMFPETLEDAVSTALTRYLAGNSDFFKRKRVDLH